MIFGKQKFDVKQLEDLKMNNFMFNVTQLKMSRFIKYIWQLIISTSNATLEVPSLHPWKPPIPNKNKRMKFSMVIYEYGSLSCLPEMYLQQRTKYFYKNQTKLSYHPSPLFQYCCKGFTRSPMWFRVDPAMTNGREGDFSGNFWEQLNFFSLFLSTLTSIICRFIYFS